MPTVRNMMEKFKEENRYTSYNKYMDNIIFGNKDYSLIIQDELTKILDTNVIKTTKKDDLNRDIKEAIEASFEKMKRFKDKVQAKEVYSDLVNFLNSKYYFNIDIDDVLDTLIGTSEERCIYLLRETERRNSLGEKMSLENIADKLGCNVRTLQKDVKTMTEQGFKLLGQNIKIVEERDEVINMDSTPHPIVLMQNISQIMVMLEGLRTMENTKAYKNYASHTAINIWNQLTEYTQNKILDAIELLNKDSGEIIKWYLDLRRDSTEHRKFLNEMKNSEGNTSSQLMYLAKNQKPFSITFTNGSGEKEIISDCVVDRIDVFGEFKVVIRSGDLVLEVNEDDIDEVIPL